MPLEWTSFRNCRCDKRYWLGCSREAIRRGAHVFGIGRRSEHPLEGARGL